MADQASATTQNGAQNNDKQAEEFKNAGNELYKKQQYSEAITQYSKAIGTHCKISCRHD